MSQFDRLYGETMNLMYLARNGLGAAQTALHVVGNNLSNAMTPGYSRQSAQFGEAGGRTTANGFFGYGTQINGIERAYSGFANQQLRDANSSFMQHDGRLSQLSQIDKLFGDDSANFSVSLNNLFKGLETLNGDASSASARQAAYLQFTALTSQLNTQGQALNGLQKSSNSQIEQSVTDINDVTRQLASLNEEIGKIHGQTGNLPADLLDLRDGLLNKLSGQVGIRVSENSATGRVDVTLENGFPLVNGHSAYTLSTAPSAEDPLKTVVMYRDAAGNEQRLDESKLSHGKLGGLFTFRNNDLLQARDELNQLALQMAQRFNTVNRDGYDAAGKPGGDIFNIPQPVAQANRNNRGSATLDVSFSDISQVQTGGYTLSMTDSGDWQVKSRDGRVVPHTVDANTGALQFDGLSISVTPGASPGDSFSLNPLDNVAARLQVALSNGDGIAASGSADADDKTNNENLKEMLAIQTEALVGKATLSEAYSSLVGRVGATASAAESDATQSAKALEAAAMEQQAIAGVDLNEEYISLQMYTQYYQANSQVLQTANTLFDALLSLR